MKQVSKSPERHTFQKKGIIDKLSKEKDRDKIDNMQAMIDMYDQIIKDHNRKFDDPKSRENNMEYDLLTTNWILEKVRSTESYAQNLYAAICNNDFQKLDVLPILKNQTWGASWRSAGGIVADMRQEGDYIDWYCSGSGGLNREYEGNETNEQWQTRTKFVPEGKVTDEIRNDLQRLGWVVMPGGDWENF
jgi:hypothetical protein